MNILLTDIKYLPTVGPKRAELLGKELNILCYKDLLYFFPFRYVDRSKFYAISEIDSANAYVQLRGIIKNITNIGEGRSRRLVASFSDDTGVIELVFFKGIKWISEKLKIGSEYIVFGKPSNFNGNINMVHPEIEEVSLSKPDPNAVMTGVYPSTEKLKNSQITNKVISKLQAIVWDRCKDYIKETLPPYLLESMKLCGLKTALSTIHFPKDMQTLAKARERLKFEELFFLQLSLLKQKNVRTRSSNGVVFRKLGSAFNDTYNNLQFPLTGAQKKVIKEIRADVTSGKQMNRLLEGDVGSGKTLVAILSALQAIDNGYQACIMAPTEVLAEQHYKGVGKFVDTSKVKCALLTGSTKTKERREIYQGLEDGSINLVFGTHALIVDKVKFANLGLAVIDEQHRFGVDQRSKLWSKSAVTPHILVMTATPIPRTLAMTLYGDLDVSVIDELPPGRKLVITKHVSENNHHKVYEFMKKQIDVGRQVFVVYPLIQESEKMDYENLESGYLQITEAFPAPKYVTAVVHGKQTAENKAFDMDLFVKGKANILVATSVIEVGVDVPNASVMVIESAERFGLSQLHQLRGRVGRGSAESYCILMTGYKLSKEARQRIDIMCSTTDGFALAEQDLRMRGPGDFEGTKQSGLAIDLHIADLSKDNPLLLMARETAEKILENDPILSTPDNQILQDGLQEMKTEIKDYSIIS
ncbi:MAG: ATP-dependent DNA helicase RecG [Bacteroidales bacterium]|nr:ATP-dependent DNA helicase RecG [Bacteroidales bacterium]